MLIVVFNDEYEATKMLPFFGPSACLTCYGGYLNAITFKKG